MPEVKFIDVTKKYGRIMANNKVNLCVKNKEYVAIIGPSGCGKTTLIKCIAGIIKPDEGEIYIDGKCVNDIAMEDRGIGYVFQNIALFPHMDVWDNVTYGPRVKGWSLEKTKPVALEMLELIKLDVRSDAYPSELSGGMQQKTAIARALTARTELLLFDEPLGALDALVRSELRYELKKLVKDLGLTAIHVTHDQEEAMAISDRLIVMKAGRIVEVGTPTELYVRPKNIFTANFIGEANFFEGEIVRLQEEEEKWDDGGGDVNSIIEIRGGIRLIARGEKRKKGDKVVIAFRPEFVSVKKGESKGVNALLGLITEIDFAGSFNRIKVKLKNDDLVSVKVPQKANETLFSLGEKVTIQVFPENVLLYSYPKAGLDAVLSLE